MIPQRIALRGFMSYRDEQELSFEGASLWVLAGPNGAGKSAIFDAITFALFGCYRGKSQEARHLINHQADTLSVEFDFLLDERAYRVRRTLSRKGRSSWEAFSGEPAEGGKLRYRPVEDADGKDGFERWRDQLLGLSYEAFTSSVLLQQGHSEKLLQVTPKERYEILTQLIDLSPYQRLAERADRRRKQLEVELSRIEGELRGASPIAQEDLDAAEQAVTQATAAHGQAEEQVRGLSDLLQHAREGERLQKARDKLQEQQQQGQALLARMDEIERAVERWRELHAVLPVLTTLARERALQAQKEREATDLARRMGDLPRQLAAAEERHGEAAAELAQMTQEFEQARAQLDELGQRLGEVTPLAALLEPIQQAERRLQALSVQPAARLAEDLGKLTAEQDRLQRELFERRQAEQELSGQAAAAAALHKEALRHRAEFEKAAASPTCQLCGQAITREHAESEGARLATLVQETAGRHKALSQAAEEARRLRTEMEERQARGQAQLAEMQKKHALQQAAEQEVRRQLDELLRSCTREQAVRARAQQDELRAQQAQAHAQQEQRRHQRERLSAQARATQAEVERLRKNLQAEQERLSVLRATREQSARYLLTTLSSLPASFRDRGATLGEAELVPLQAEEARLRPYEEQSRDLDQARRDRDLLAEQLAAVEAQLQEVPEQARLPREDLERDLQRARDERDRSSEALLAATGQQRWLGEQQRKHKKLLDRQKDIERQQRLHKVLAELLGREGLQMHLLRRAESAIVELANEELGKLSQGRLRLGLRRADASDKAGSGTHKALDLIVYNEDTGTEPTDVMLASGSQRFRIAISLALAIGRYAERHARRIESVIIDEGFGCLDTLGREETVRALTELKEQLRRIILVSHQEEFTRAFACSYQVRLQDKTSVAARQA